MSKTKLHCVHPDGSDAEAFLAASFETCLGWYEHESAPMGDSECVSLDKVIPTLADWQTRHTAEWICFTELAVRDCDKNIAQL